MRIVLHPRDHPSMYHPLFQQDPEKFQPKPDPGSDTVDRWGVRPDDEWYERNGMQAMMHVMTTQMLYGRFSDNPELKHPEQQFVEVLLKRKEAALAAALPSVKPLFQQDLIIDIEMWHIKPRIWRRFKVSGGMTLAVLQDKVISPVMGWVRHYHAYCFHDGKDGAVFGPAYSTAIDMMHAARSVVLMMDDTKYKVAQLLNKPGDKATYTYDLGDNWWHTMTLVEVLPPEKSDGNCKVLDGAMACPPEDSNGFEGMGNMPYQDYLHEWSAAKGSKRQALVKGAQRASKAGPSWAPDKFSVDECNKALAAALRSKASAAGGEKEFIMPLQPGGLNMFGAQPSRGQNSSTIARPNGFFEREVIKTRRDPKNLAVCAECGSPHDLKYCSGCRQVRFCGPACHKKAWKAWHKPQCQEHQQKQKLKGSSSSSGSAGASSSKS